MLKLLVVVICVVAYAAAHHQAVVVLQSQVGVEGNVIFTQCEDGVKIEGYISGLSEGEHGFHVHQFGDLRKGCDSTGGHFNPFNKHHGAPNATERHVGDLGNIEADSTGVANFTMHDSLISFKGATDIIGRAIVVHSGRDDLGLGGESDSLTTGHAGSRVACGLIGRLMDDGNFASFVSPIQLTIVLCSLLPLIISKI